MATVKYIGRTTDFKGKPLWTIVSNLKNFGVGRVVVRSMMERYAEKSYMRILKVEACTPGQHSDGQPTRRVNVWVEKVFRGKKFDKPINVRPSSYKADFRLLSKQEEAEYCQVLPIAEKLIAPYMDLPPLLKEFVTKETGRSDHQMKVLHSQRANTIARVAKDGEKPNVFPTIGIGKPHPKSGYLYEGIKL